jgi:hypothetical protein
VAERESPTDLHQTDLFDADNDRLCPIWGLRFRQTDVGIPNYMDKLTRLRHAQQRIVRAQQRVWLVQVLTWPALIAAGVLSLGGLVWILRRRYAGGRHEMPDTPGAHEAGSVHVEPDGRLSHE